jgi:3-isopropylmalate/(R)-2-methylmalate dehydratase small subunit
VEPTRRQALLEGLDAVGMALGRAHEIRAFEARHFERSPWLEPRAAV